MTHSSQTVVDCNYALALCVRSLLKGNSAESAYEEIRTQALRSQSGFKSWFTEAESNIY